MKGLLFGAALWLSIACSAQAQVEVIVSQTSTGADRAGNIFSAVLQRSIEKSGKYVMVSSKDGAAFYLQVQTMGMDELTKSFSGRSVAISMYSVLLLIRLEDGTYTYMDNWAGYCGEERAIEMADEIAKKAIDGLDKVVSAIRADRPQGSKL